MYAQTFGCEDENEPWPKVQQLFIGPNRFEKRQKNSIRTRKDDAASTSTLDQPLYRRLGTCICFVWASASDFQAKGMPWDVILMISSRNIVNNRWNCGVQGLLRRAGPRSFSGANGFVDSRRKKTDIEQVHCTAFRRKIPWDLTHRLVRWFELNYNLYLANTSSITATAKPNDIISELTR